MIAEGVWNGVINPFGAQTAAGLAAIEPPRSSRPPWSARTRSTLATSAFQPGSVQLPAGPLGMAFGVEYRKEKFVVRSPADHRAAGQPGHRLRQRHQRQPQGCSGVRRVEHSGDQEPRAHVGGPLRQVQRLRQHLQSEGRHCAISRSRNCCCAVRRTRASAHRRCTRSTSPQSLYVHHRQLRRPAPVPGRHGGGGRSRRAWFAASRCCSAPRVRWASARPSIAQAREVERPSRWAWCSSRRRQSPSASTVWQIRIKNLISASARAGDLWRPGRVRRPLRPLQPAPGGPRASRMTRRRRCLPNFPPSTRSRSSMPRTRTSASCTPAASTCRPPGVRVPTASGSFGVSMDGTYVTKYVYQRELNGAFFNAAGRYSDNAPVFRWQHVADRQLEHGPLGGALWRSASSGLHRPGRRQPVGSYSIFDASVTWTGVKNLTVTAGINNLFDTDRRCRARTPRSSVAMTRASPIRWVGHR